MKSNSSTTGVSNTVGAVRSVERSARLGVSWLLLAIVLSCSTAGLKSDQAITDPSDPDISELISLQLKLASAMAPFDSMALDTILANDLRSINAADKVLDKATIFLDLRNAQPVLARVTDDSIVVRRFGNMAIMTLRETVSMKDGTLGHLRMTEIWLKRSGRWQAVGGQALVIP